MKKLAVPVTQLVMGFPKSLGARSRAIRRILNRQGILGAGPIVLNPATLQRIIDANLSNANLIAAIITAQSKATNNIKPKKKAAGNCELKIKQYIGQLKNALDNDFMGAGDHILFGVDSKYNYPAMATDEDTLDVAANLIKGAAAFAGKGGIPMVSPTIGDVEAMKDILQVCVDDQSVFDSALTKALSDLKKTNKATDSLIKRAWKEIQIYYSELPRETMRSNSRLWGVVYIAKKARSIATMRVLDENGNPNLNVTATLEETSATGRFDKFGVMTLKTGLVGEGTIILEQEGKESKLIPVIFTEGKNLDLGTVTF